MYQIITENEDVSTIITENEDVSTIILEGNPPNPKFLQINSGSLRSDTSGQINFNQNSDDYDVFAHKFADIVDPNWLDSLYGSYKYPQNVNRKRDNGKPSLKCSVNSDNKYIGSLECFDNNGRKQCILEWYGYHSILHDGQLGLYPTDVNCSYAMGYDKNGDYFRFEDRILKTGKWPGFLVMVNHF